MKQFEIGEIRVQLLSSDIVRVEKRGKDGFFDGNSYFIPDREALRGVDGEKSESDGVCTVTAGNVKIEVRKPAKKLGDVRVVCGDKSYKPARKVNCGELPLPSRTPCFFPVYDNPRIEMPDCGYTAGARYKVRENADDVYILICGGDHRKLRRLYVQLTGRSELVRLSTLGFWNSRYYKHDDASARAMIDAYAAHDIPLDNMVLDTDWRKASDRGIGYEIDEELFPDMRAFFGYAHSRGVEIMFNDHPEPVEGAASALDGIEAEYRAKHLAEHLRNGLDYWWYDRNWHTKLISPSPRVAPESIGMYLFYDVTRRTFESVAQSGKAARRPVIMANVDNIVNGNYEGINDTASHRYSVQWTGDIGSDGASLAMEIKNLVRGQNSGIAYINSDCGGHTGNPTAHEYVRWMQFGAFSPVFRPHSTNGVVRFREPWAYDGETLDIAREYVKMRYRLLPLMYKCAYENYESGAPLLTPLFYEYASDKKAAKIYDEYMFGKGILVAPLHGTSPDKVDASRYVAPVKATYYDGTECKGEPLWSTEYSALDLYWSGTSPHPSVPAHNFSAVFETELRFETDAELVTESDDGVTVYVDGVKTLDDRTFHSMAKMSAGKLSGGKTHKVRLKYFQGGGDAGISLYSSRLDVPCNLDERLVYLPKGEWTNAFDGKKYAGGKTYLVRCAANEMPLFVKSGSAIPVAKCEQTTKLMDMSDVTFEYFPSKTEEYADFLYEDDGETVAYKRGEHRITPYCARYDGAAMVFTLGKSEGTFVCAKNTRKVKIKYRTNGAAVKAVRVNGKDAEYKIHKRDARVYPFHSGCSACDSDVLCVEFVCGTDAETKVEFVLA